MTPEPDSTPDHHPPASEENAPRWPGDPARGEVAILHQTVVWSNDHAAFVVDRVRYPDRGGRRPEDGEMFRLANADGRAPGVVVVPITGDHRILLVRQFRHAVRMWVRELPRGGRAAGEPPEAAVRRELREEVGCDVDAVHPLGHVAPDTGRLADVVHLFAAQVRQRGSREQEETETIDRVIPYTIEALERACEDGAILDGYTLAAVLRLRPHFQHGRFIYRPVRVVDPMAPAEGAAG